MALKIDFFEREDIGKVRIHQEDSHGHALGTPNGDVFVLCDGMGGHVGGKQASMLAVTGVLEYLQREKYVSAETALLECLEYANQKILTYVASHPELKGMGTTACVLLLQGNCAYVAHAGDSRIYLYLGQEKQLYRITKDHSYVQTLVDSGQISDEEAERHPRKNIIQKALGSKQSLNPTIEPLPVLPKKGDVFLLCSDGLSGMVQDAVMKSVFDSVGSLVEKGNILIDIALTNGGSDNVTIQLVLIEESPHKITSYHSFNPISSRIENTPLPKPYAKWIVVSVVFVLLLGLISAYLVAKCQWSTYERQEIEIGNINEAIALNEKNLEEAKRDLKKAKDDYERCIKSMQKDNEVAEKDWDKKNQERNNEIRSYSDCEQHAKQQVNSLDSNQEELEKKLSSAQKKLAEMQENKFFVRLGRRFRDSINQITE